MRFFPSVTDPSHLDCKASNRAPFIYFVATPRVDFNDVEIKVLACFTLLAGRVWLIPLRQFCFLKLCIHIKLLV